MVRKKLEYRQLPPGLTSVFIESDFLKSYDFSNEGFIVAWFINKAIGRQQEVVFSLKEGHILSRAERESAFPAKEDIYLADQGYRVIKNYQLEPDTDVCYETYDVYPEGVESKLLTCSQIYYAPAHRSIGEVVNSALKIASFPMEYARWSVPERVNYWTSALYRLRHQMGEIGAKEDDAFDPALIGKMRAVDANVDSILPIILGRLATMEAVTPHDLALSFNKRTGLSVAL